MKKPFTFSCYNIDQALQEGMNEYHRQAGNKELKDTPIQKKIAPKETVSKKSWVMIVASFFTSFLK